MRLYRRGWVWWAWFYDADGRRRQVSTRCHDRRAAETAAREIERRGADPDYRAADATLTDALDLLLEDRREQAHVGRKSEATVRFYEKKAGHWVRIFETDDAGEYRPFLLTKLEARHVDDFISQRRREGASESTIHKELVMLRAALKLALRRGLWRGQIGTLLPAGFSPEYKPRSRHLSPTS